MTNAPERSGERRLDPKLLEILVCQVPEERDQPQGLGPRRGLLATGIGDLSERRAVDHREGSHGHP